MAKIIYNACFGGFSVSEAGMRRYAELKGVPLYVEGDEWNKTYWLVPPEERGEVLSAVGWITAPTEERTKSNAAYARLTISSRDFDRCDPVLVQVIEELGEAASGAHAKLRVAEVASGSRYRIDEYDGLERVGTPDSYEWMVAP